MNKIEIQDAVKALAVGFRVYDGMPFEGCRTFTQTFDGRKIELTLEKDEKIMKFIVNNFGLIEKDIFYKFKFTDAPPKIYGYAKISFASTSREELISKEEVCTFLRAVFKCNMIAHIFISNVCFGKVISLNHGRELQQGFGHLQEITPSTTSAP